MLGPLGEPHAATPLVAPSVHRDGRDLIAFVDGGGSEKGARYSFLFAGSTISSVTTPLNTTVACGAFASAEASLQLHA